VEEFFRECQPVDFAYARIALGEIPVHELPHYEMVARVLFLRRALHNTTRIYEEAQGMYGRPPQAQWRYVFERAVPIADNAVKAQRAIEGAARALGVKIEGR
jgi:hypothetical protein